MGRLKHQQVADDLRSRILSGQYPPGHVLPTHIELAAGYGVAKETAATAVRALERQGLVRSVRHTGTIVLSGNEAERTDLRISALNWVTLAGPVAHTTPVPTDIAVLLGQRPDDQIVAHDDLVGPVGGPTALLRTVYRSQQGNDDSLVWNENVTARMPSDGEARVLRVSGRMPLLRVLQIGRRGRHGVEVRDLRVCGQRYEVSAGGPKILLGEKTMHGKTIRKPR